MLKTTKLQEEFAESTTACLGDTLHINAVSMGVIFSCISTPVAIAQGMVLHTVQVNGNHIENVRGAAFITGKTATEKLRDSEKIPSRKLAIQKARERMANEMTRHVGNETLATLRLKLGMSQQNLADAIASKQSYIAKIENNRTDVRASTLHSLAKALGVSDQGVNEALQNGWAMIDKNKGQAS